MCSPLPNREVISPKKKKQANLLDLINLYGNELNH